ncbi:MAG: hypothetical protein LBP32_05085 [Spirochaetaceae bacterium]|jgi:tetratricopeptide (TPR) repeat protein|nr:hypothetical protein [Spirochaetaceae bacterium]
MNRFLGILFFAALLVSAVSAQNDTALFELAGAAGQYYEVLSDGGKADAETLVRELELRFDVYNRLFRFDPSLISAPLKVRAYRDREAYDNYVSARLGRPREGAVYLHYSQGDRRELVLHRGSGGEETIFPHQAFIQFLRAFIPYPPAWMREGFAIYFTTLGFNRETGELTYEENLAWLETVKHLAQESLVLDRVFFADRGAPPEHFQPLSWSVISFFLNSGQGTYFRTLTESFRVLSPSATAAENSEAVMGYISRWTDPETMQKDYETYLMSQKTFAELIDEGQKAYAAKDTVTAELSFYSALDQKPAHYVPYYYLGLLAYEEQNYDMAEQYYRSALQYGADAALVYYALGLNAAAAGRGGDAAGFLEQAAAASPERYKNRVQDLINRLRN